MATAMSSSSNNSPVMKIIRIGFAENDVIPSIDRLSILDNGYFVSPATRQARGYLTTDVSSPIAGIIPRKNRLLSPYSLKQVQGPVAHKPEVSMVKYSLQTH